MRFSVFLVAAFASASVMGLAFPAANNGGGLPYLYPTGYTTSSTSSSLSSSTSKPYASTSTSTSTWSTTEKTTDVPTTKLTGTGGGPTGTYVPPPISISTSTPPAVTKTVYGPGKTITTSTIYDTTVYTTSIATFCPTSTVVGTSAGTTYYSTYLSVSYYTTCPTVTKTRYEVILPTGAGAVTTVPAGTGGCPAPSTIYSTIISYVTVPIGGGSVPITTDSIPNYTTITGPAPPCDKCHVITYTLPNGSVTTETVTTTETDTKTKTKTKPILPTGSVGTLSSIPVSTDKTWTMPKPTKSAY